MGHVGMLLLSVLLVSAVCTSLAKVQARYTRYSIQLSETIPPMGGVKVFEPLQTEEVPRKGFGYVKHNNLLTRDGKVAASSAGIFFYHNQLMIEDIVTITFSEELDGIWSGSSITLRGYWKLDSNGTATSDAKEQELAIVGGQGGLRDAMGTVYFVKVATLPRPQFLLTCDIYVNNELKFIPKTHVDLDSQFKPLS